MEIWVGPLLGRLGAITILRKRSGHPTMTTLWMSAASIGGTMARPMAQQMFQSGRGRRLLTPKLRRPHQKKILALPQWSIPKPQKMLVGTGQIGLQQMAAEATEKKTIAHTPIAHTPPGVRGVVKAAPALQGLWAPGPDVRRSPLAPAVGEVAVA